MSNLQAKTTINHIEPTVSLTNTITQGPEKLIGTAGTQPKSFIEWGDEDCILRFPGEFGELTTISRTYVENEPKKNIERTFGI